MKYDALLAVLAAGSLCCTAARAEAPAPTAAAESPDAARTEATDTRSGPFVQGQVFSGWTDRFWSGGSFNAFTLDRAELGGGWAWEDTGGFLLNIEGVRSAGPESLLGVDGDSIVMRVKHAYGFGHPEIGPGRLVAEAGMVPDVWVQSLERAYDLRGFAPTAAEATGFFDTSDLGVTVGYDLLDGLVTARVSATNGEGRNDIELNRGKNTTALLTTTPVTFDIWGDQARPTLHLGARDGSVGVARARNHRLFGAVTLAHPRLGAGFEFEQALGHSGNGSLEGQALGAWVRVEPFDRWLGLFARFDRYDPDIDADDDDRLSIGGGLYSDLLRTDDRTNRVRLFGAFTMTRVGDAAPAVPGVPDATDFSTIRLGLEASGAFPFRIR